MTKTKSSITHLLGFTALAVIALVVSAYSQTEAVPQRTDIDGKYKWNLEDIYLDTIAWSADFQYVEQNYPKLGSFAGKLGQSSQNLADCLILRDELNKKLGAMYVYAFMKYHEDTRISFYQELQQRITALDAQYEASISFIKPEILSIPDETLQAYLADNPNLKDYKFYINDLIRSKAHILSQEEERILALSSPVAQGPEYIFDMTFYTDVKFPTIVDDKGDSVQLSPGRFSKMMESPDRDFRYRAAKAYADAYQPYFNTFGAALTTSINTDWFYTQARNYKTCLEYKLDDYNIPRQVYDNLVSAVNTNMEPLHKWVALRKKIMKLDEIHGYDLSVPLVPNFKNEVPYDQAVETVMKALKPLGNKYIGDLNTAFNSGWVDVYETEGKYSGGYTWGSYITHPYVLLNYNNSNQEMFTLAHEMGHAMHRNYSNTAQPYPLSGHSIFVAEVASTVNESILIDYLIKNAKSDDEKLYYLTYYIEQIIGTFYFQTMFSEFEKVIHETVENGGALSAESMRDMYTELNTKYWGPDYVLDEWSGKGGLRISHFYNSYYVYQYSTSYAAAQAISRKIIAGDKATRDKYLEFLSWGGNDYPVTQLQKIGVDMTKPDAINATIETFGKLVDQVEKIMAKKGQL